MWPFLHLLLLFIPRLLPFIRTNNQAYNLCIPQPALIRSSDDRTLGWEWCIPWFIHHGLSWFGFGKTTEERTSNKYWYLVFTCNLWWPFKSPVIIRSLLIVESPLLSVKLKASILASSCWGLFFPRLDIIIIPNSCLGFHWQIVTRLFFSLGPCSSLIFRWVSSHHFLNNGRDLYSEVVFRSQPEMANNPIGAVEAE